MTEEGADDGFILPSDRKEDEFILPSDREPKASSTSEASSKKGILTNSEGDSEWTKAGKGAATAVIEGVADIPGLYGNMRDMSRYVADRANSWISGRSMEEVKAQREKFGKLPGDYMPTGDDIAKLAFNKTGEYTPEDTLGRIGMAAVRAGTGGFGLGAASKVGQAAKTVPEVLGAVTSAAPQFPMNTAIGAASQGATEATGDPLYGMAAGAVAGPAAHAGYSKFVEPIVRPAWGAVNESSAKTQAGERLLQSAEDPEAFRRAINSDRNLNQGIAESPKTAGQITNDRGVLQTERMLNDNDKDFETRMRSITDRQNQARLDKLNEVAPVTARPQAVVEAIEQRHEGITQKYDALVEGLRKQAEKEAANLGDAADPQEIGERLRKAVDTARQDQKAEIDKLYNAVDPDGTMNLNVGSIKETADKIIKSEMPDESPYSPVVNSVLGAIGKWGEIIPFKKLRALDTRLSAEMSGERRARGETPDWKILKDLKGSVKEAINKAIADHVAWEDAAEIKPKDGLEGRVGQIDDGPSLFGDAPSDIGEGIRQARVSNGIPEVAAGAEGGTNSPANVRSGNADSSPRLAQETTPIGPEGRLHYPEGNVGVRYEVVDLDDIHTSHDTSFNKNPKYDQSLQPRDRSTKEAQDQVLTYANKFNPELLGRSAEANTGAPLVGADGMVESGNGRTIAGAINYERGDPGGYRKWLESQGYDTTGMKRPFLVARRTTEMSPESRQRMTKSINAPTGLKMSSTEQAAVDADLLSPDVVSKLGDGAINSEANRDFVFAFLNKLSANDRGNMISGAQRKLTPDGQKRVEAALLQSAYGDADLVRRGFESPDNNIKNITGALTDAAGPWAKVRAAVRDGLISEDHDVTAQLVDLVKDIMRARDENIPVRKVLNQADMMRSKAGEAIRELLLNGDNVASRQQIAARLTKYAQEALKNTQEDALFASDVTPLKILKTAAGAGEEMQVAPDKIEANADAGQLQKLKEANSRYGEYARTYKQGPVGETLKVRGFSGDYNVMDSAVANKAVKQGDVGYQTAMKFIDASKRSPEAISALKDQLLNKFIGAIGPEGVLKQEAFDRLTQRFDGAIRAVNEVSPGFRAALAKPAAAGKAMTDMMARRKLGLDALKKEEAAKFLGAKSDLDIQNKLGSMIGRKGASPDKVRQFMSTLNDDAKEGVQRAFVDWMFRNETNKGDILSAAKIDTLMKQNRAVLAEVFTPEQMNVLRAIQRDLQLSDRTAKAASSHGSRTARDVNPALKNALAAVGEKGGYLAMLGILYHSYETGGLRGLMTTGAGAAAYSLIKDLRSSGHERINGILKDALTDPIFARELLRRVPEKVSRSPQGPMQHFWNFYVQSLWRNGMAAPKYPFAGQAADKREGRAAGGRIGAALTPEQIISGLEKCRKGEQKRTEVILNQPDENVVRALAAANQHI